MSEFVNGPLNGVKIVDFASYLAAPAAAKMLGDMGAEVIKIEPLSGDPARNFGAFLGLPSEDDENPLLEYGASNKKAISLDIKTDEGMEILLKMLEDADVFITNTRPSVLTRLGLTYEDLALKYPGLIYAYVNGLGEEGPDSDRPGFDVTSYWSRGGFFAQLGEPDAEPISPTTGFGDNPTSVALAMGILAALYRKKQTGLGDKVSASLYHTAIWTNSLELCAANYIDTPKKSRKSPQQAVSNPYKCADDKWITLCIVNFDKEWASLCKALGREDFLSNPLFEDFFACVINREELVAEFDKTFATQPRSYWENALATAVPPIPYEICQTFKEITTDEQALINGYLAECTYRNGNKKYLPTFPVKLKSLGTTAYNHSCPRLGENTREILKGLGYADDKIKKMMENNIVIAYTDK